MNLIAVSCSISKGPFSGEHVFEIKTITGEMHLGVASPIYCWDQDGHPLPPLNGSAVPGKVAARLLHNEGSRAIIVVPGNEVVEVDANMTSARPK